jgi:hypothetical protein
MKADFHLMQIKLQTGLDVLLLTDLFPSGFSYHLENSYRCVKQLPLHYSLQQNKCSPQTFTHFASVCQ